jgi:hypothetical protein
MQYQLVKRLLEFFEKSEAGECGIRTNEAQQR